MFRFPSSIWWRRILKDFHICLLKISRKYWKKRFYQEVIEKLNYNMEERVAACLFLVYCLISLVYWSMWQFNRFIEIHWSLIIIYFQTGAFSQLNWRQISSILSANSPTKIYKNLEFMMFHHHFCCLSTNE